jgi:hypothetical protein
MRNFTTFINDQDPSGQKRFFEGPIEQYMWKEKSIKVMAMYYDSPQGSLNCCSDLVAHMHYVKPWEMYLYEYLVYRVHPFGIEKNLTETIPGKLSMQEILKWTNAESPNFKMWNSIEKRT